MRLTTLANHYIRQLSVFKSFVYRMIIVQNQAGNPNMARRKNQLPGIDLAVYKSKLGKLHRIRLREARAKVCMQA